MTDRAGLKVASELAAFVERRALPGTGIEPEAFWAGAADIFARLAPENAALLAKRDLLQVEIDGWLAQRAGEPIDQLEYQAFLKSIGYLVDQVLNARFVLTAANARWGSLYDALYGTDAIPGRARAGGYDPQRGAQVIAWAKRFLDAAVPLANGSWADLKGAPELADPALLIGREGENYLFSHNGLHIEVAIDREHPIGRDDPAGIADVVLESALSTIVDLEDSIAAVAAADKVAAYANWLGLMKGDLAARFDTGGRAMTRALEPDRSYTTPDGTTITLPGRGLLFVRNVGHLMTTPAILLADGSEAPEGILDGIVTSLIAIHDLQLAGKFVNSRAGSIYIVKPMMHGPDEAAFTNRLFDAIEEAG